MRSCLPDAKGSENFGLAYDVLGASPSSNDDERGRSKWLEAPEDYRMHYLRWKASFGSEAKLSEVAMASRLLVGHGNPSAAEEIGLTVHRSWGTPIIPGTALKGLVASYVDAVYGPDPDASATSHVNRDDWAAPTWKGRRVIRPPGKWHGTIFGSPPVGTDYRHGLKGGVTFHDALYIPGEERNRPYEVDILTVHQKPYYDARGRDWPNDWNDPVPVRILTVRPGTRFLLALEGPPKALELAMKLLLTALAEWGVGGKTSLGYGRIHDAVETSRIDIEASTKGAAWVDSTLSELMARHRKNESTILRSRGLADEWQKIDDAALKREARDEIVARWKKIGLWDNTTGKAARRAKAIYKGAESSLES